MKWLFVKTIIIHSKSRATDLLFKCQVKFPFIGKQLHKHLTSIVVTFFSIDCRAFQSQDSSL